MFNFLIPICAFIFGFLLAYLCFKLRSCVGSLHVDTKNSNILLEFYKTIPELHLEDRNYILVKIVNDDLSSAFSQENLDL